VITRASAVVLAALVVAAAGGCGGSDGPSERESAASRLVATQVGRSVDCRDNGAVNTEVHPEYPVGYSCFAEDGAFYAAVVSPDGILTSLNGPAYLKPAGS
jgi:hypothetical protein